MNPGKSDAAIERRGVETPVESYLVGASLPTRSNPGFGPRTVGECKRIDYIDDFAHLIEIAEISVLDELAEQGIEFRGTVHEGETEMEVVEHLRDYPPDLLLIDQDLIGVKGLDIARELLKPTPSNITLEIPANATFIELSMPQIVAKASIHRAQPFDGIIILLTTRGKESDMIQAVSAMNDDRILLVDKSPKADKVEDGRSTIVVGPDLLIIINKALADRAEAREKRLKAE